MRSIITLAGIDEAIDNLHYSDRVLKYKLIHSIREYYEDEASIESIVDVPSDELIKRLWDTGDDPIKIKNKRRNLSSVKSSINADLKKLHDQGRNSEGISISPANIFVMSDEAKTKILESFTYDAKGESPVPLTQIMDVLKTVNDILQKPEDMKDSDEDGLKKLDQLKEIIQGLSQKVGLQETGEVAKATETGLDANGMDAASSIVNALGESQGVTPEPGYQESDSPDSPKSDEDLEGIMEASEEPEDEVVEDEIFEPELEEVDSEEDIEEDLDEVDELDDDLGSEFDEEEFDEQDEDIEEATIADADDEEDLVDVDLDEDLGEEVVESIEDEEEVEDVEVEDGEAIEEEEDLDELVSSFIAKYSKLHGKPIIGISDDALALIKAYNWPGNVRELMNCIESAVVMARNNRITMEEIPEYITYKAPDVELNSKEGLLHELERKAIIDTLNSTQGEKVKAAKILGIGLRTLYRKIEKYELEG